MLLNNVIFTKCFINFLKNIIEDFLIKHILIFMFYNLINYNQILLLVYSFLRVLI